MRAPSLFALLLGGCAPLAAPQPWTQVGPSRVQEVLVRHQCNACHSVQNGFGAASPTEQTPEEACTRKREDGEQTAHCEVPALVAMGRFRARWLREFLAEPAAIRPGLVERMPRPALTAAEVDTLVVGWGAAEEEPQPRAVPEAAELARGAALFKEKQCAVCHHFGESGLLPGTSTARQRALAPDLSHTRQRLPQAMVARFIAAPQEVKPGTEMPQPAVTPAEARALAAFVVFGGGGRCSPLCDNVRGP